MNPSLPQPVDSSSSYSFRLQDMLLGAQMLFIAFGALVLVPILAGLDPNVALFTAGIGTLVFQLITKGKVPAFLASSFAFIAPITAGIQQFGLAATMSGLAAAGLLYMLLSLLVLWRGPDPILKVLPPIVTGPVIMVIGLSLAPIAIQMASEAGSNYGVGTAQFLAALALFTTIVAALLARGTFQLVPILMGISVGYVGALLLGIVDFAPVLAAPWFMLPHFTSPTLHWPAIAFFIPVAIAPAIEHIGDILVISSVTGDPLLRDPGLHRTLLGDGVATSIAAMLGGPPNTTYSEVTGAVALTRAFNPGIMTWAALIAVMLSFSGKLGALLRTIPPPVMGGVLVVLFGTIVVVGINSLVQSGSNLLQSRNMIIVGVILVLGAGNMSLAIGQFSLEGIGLSSLMGVLLNSALPNPSPGE
ncbi:uracil-xanthine permease family protein [Acaryochloris marina]|uniref:uracil-xanthine permease family protein n=1 Tax=Acaryochloris marina TaxID=155978 RepID=UPI001BB001E8|nr:uracil-xanthine permease family protein [Acaryochloris marina]QUY40445.1 uracil-xanthine permease [Acaryochloris marina S15]